MIETRPSTSALKRSLLTALRCVDPDSEKRPKMSQVVRMLESEEYPIPREVCHFIILFSNVERQSVLYENIFVSLYFITTFRKESKIKGLGAQKKKGMRKTTKLFCFLLLITKLSS